MSFMTLNRCLSHDFLCLKPCLHRKVCSSSYDINPIRVLFFGVDNFSLPTLELLHQRINNHKQFQHESSALGVVTTSMKSNSPVNKYAKQNGLPVIEWSPNLDVNGYNIAIVASFGHLIPKKIVDYFKGNILNVHASVLPHWRGAAPINHTILHGDAYSGVTILQVNAHKFDTGRVLAQNWTIVPEHIRANDLTNQLAKLGAELLDQCMHDLSSSLKQAQCQLEIKSKWAPCLTRNDLKVNWKSPASFIIRQWHAMPESLITSWHGRRVRIIQIHHIPVQLTDVSLDLSYPAQLHYCHVKRLILVRCADHWLQLEMLQIAGKAAMSSHDFFNGFVNSVELNQQCFELV